MKDEVKAYGFMIAESDARKHIDGIKAAKGLMGVHVPKNPGKGLLVVFWNENDAKICRNIMEFAGCRVGGEVMEVFIPKSDMEVLQNAD